MVFKIKSIYQDGSQNSETYKLFTDLKGSPYYPVGQKFTRNCTTSYSFQDK